MWLPRRLWVRVTAPCGIWSLLPRTASLGAWNSTMSDSCLWEIIALTPLSNSNNTPSWLPFAQSVHTAPSHWVSARYREVGSEVRKV